MDWSDVGKALTDDAPLLSRLLSGRVGLAVTAAAGVVSNALSTTAQPEAVLAAINADQAARRKVAAAERDNAGILQQLTATAAESEMQDHILRDKLAASLRRPTRSASYGPHPAQEESDVLNHLKEIEESTIHRFGDDLQAAIRFKDFLVTAGVEVPEPIIIGLARLTEELLLEMKNEHDDKLETRSPDVGADPKGTVPSGLSLSNLSVGDTKS